jgi:hypothetical protein
LQALDLAVAQSGFPKDTPSCVILLHFFSPVSQIARTANANAIPRLGIQPNQRYDPVEESQIARMSPQRQQGR